MGTWSAGGLSGWGHGTSPTGESALLLWDLPLANGSAAAGGGPGAHGATGDSALDEFLGLGSAGAGGLVADGLPPGNGGADARGEAGWSEGGGRAAAVDRPLVPETDLRGHRD